jgi:hypothetical protein
MRIGTAFGVVLVMVGTKIPGAEPDDSSPIDVRDNLPPMLLGHGRERQLVG